MTGVLAAGSAGSPPRAARPARVLGALAAGGAALLAGWHGCIAEVVLCYLVSSAGYGFAMAALPRLVNQAGPVERSGSANSVNTVSRVLGGALGSAVVAGGGGFGAAFWLAAGVAAVGGGLAVFGGLRGNAASAVHP